MKKIFAFILATIMVMSLVPASVFAAITNDTACPEYHTVKNCEYTTLGEVAATCTTPSYTAYKCNKCGEQFADNFGSKAAGHKWVDNSNDKDRKNVAVNCATKTDGKTYVKCSVCKVTEVQTTKWDKSHNWVEISGVGCEKIFECSICNAQKTDEHTWEYTKVTVEPKWEAGKYIAGQALFTCKDCKDTKTVQILDVACKCKEKVLVQAAVANNCTEDGSYAIYKCADCYQLYILVDKIYVEIDKIDSKDVIIPNKGGHKEKKDSGKLTGCVYTYTCETCKQTIVEDRHPAELIETQGDTPATCTTWGYTYKLCKACGVSFVETHEPTGHKTITKKVEATCAKAGAIYTLCCNANCSIAAQSTIVEVKDGKTYNKVVSIEPIPTNDNHKPYVMYNGKKVYDAKELPDATCDMGVVYVWTCDNGCATYFEVDQRPAAGHKMELTVESHNCAKATTTLAAWTTRIATKCSVCGVTTNSDFVNANSQVMFSSKEEAEVFHGIAFKNTDAKGKVTYSYRDGKSADSLGTPISVPGNCTVPSYDIYTCPTCGTAVYVNTGVQGHVATPGKHVAYTAAKCDKTGTVEHDICALCNAAFGTDGKTLKTTVINKCASTLATQTTNCSKVTYEKCTECGKTYTDKTASTAYTVPADAHAWKDIVAGVEATCNQAGTAKVKYCTACKALEVNRVYRNTATNEKTTEYLAASGTKFEGKKITVTLTNGAELVIEANGTVKDNKANNATLAIAKLEHTAPITGESTIKFVGESEGKADHTKVGYDHYECTYCAYEYLTEYTPATGGHINAKGEILTTKCDNANITDRICVVCDKEIKTAHDFKYEADQTVPATCVDEGYNYNYCEVCDKLIVTGKMAIDKNNHADPISVVVNYAQNGYNAGKQPCAACGYKGEAATMKDKGIEVLVSAAVNGTDADYATMGSIITVTLDLASLNGVNVWGLDFALNYNPEVLEFVAEETAFNQDSKFNTRLATDVEMEIMDRQTGKMVTVKSGIIRIAASADNAHVAIKGSQNLVTLTFKVISTATTVAELSVGKTVGDFLGFNEYDALFIDENGKSVACFKNNTNTASVELASIFDMDDNYKIDMRDALAIYTLILFNEYDVKADINADAKVDAEDFRIFYAILTGATTVDAYFNPVEEGTGSSQIQPRD